MSKQTFFAPRLINPLSSLPPGAICRITIDKNNQEWRVSAQLQHDGLTILEPMSGTPITAIVNSDQNVIHIGHIQKKPK